MHVERQNDEMHVERRNDEKERQNDEKKVPIDQ